MAEMQKRGLTIHSVSGAEATAFRATVEELTASWRGTRVPADVYDEAVRARTEYRNR